MVNIAEIVADPRYFPHVIDYEAGLVDFIQTDRSGLRSTNFLDGRTDFSAGRGVRAPVDHLFRSDIKAPQPDRYIFHIAFCGSTLLSRLLDAEGQSLVLREPHVLANIATRWATLDKQEAVDVELPAILELARALLRRRWEPAEQIVVKPTNWVNNILPQLCADPSTMRAVFLTMPRHDFVRAVFRGGEDRIAFAARAAVHLSSQGPHNANLVASALSRHTDQTGKLAGLVVVMHEIQMRMFRDVVQNERPFDFCLTMKDLLADPLHHAFAASEALELNLPRSTLEQNCGLWMARHAKQPDATFSAQDEDRATDEMMVQFGELIDQALSWAEDMLGPDQGMEVRSQPVTDSRSPAA